MCIRDRCNNSCIEGTHVVAVFSIWRKHLMNYGNTTSWKIMWLAVGNLPKSISSFLGDRTTIVPIRFGNWITTKVSVDRHGFSVAMNGIFECLEILYDGNNQEESGSCSRYIGIKFWKIGFGLPKQRKRGSKEGLVLPNSLSTSAFRCILELI